MPTSRAGKRSFPNPFYVLLLLASAAFVVTSLAYLVAPASQQQANAAGRTAGAAAWFDRHGPAALGVEFVVMLIAALLAVGTDRWFPERPARRSGPNG